ncbi:winged helix-turn-helix domain-containing protein [Serratia fonticola]|uniref:winged helix-turn-helix domain-containing protein n=1 Tax=Serratia fonticola TaxID=47917 RepID=UPI00217A377A|nr:winged helix-turn-helix domain-containing protein [Serratia fonticola]CAI1936570.1 Transcriptional regulatory protein, C terminal [Serratia fonticola]
MECIINGIVKYNSDDGTLLSPDNTIDMIKLTRVVNELLLLLINNNHSLLSRETLLRELWEKRGLNASGNNLSNYVSILRKTLAKCGCPGLITTVPKHGFLFEADITILAKVDEKQLPSSVENIENEFVLPAISTVKGNRVVFHPWLKGNRGLLGSVITLMLVLWLPGAYDQWSMKFLRTEVLTLEQCKFFLMDDVTRGLEKKDTLSILRMIVKNEKLNCSRKANVYYFADKKMDASGHVIMTDLLTYCAYDGKAPCDNYYMSKKENEDKK